MANYRTPGVHVEEISKLPPSIAQVETAIPAFIGFTEKAEKNGVSLVGKPTRIKSLTEYVEYFGSINPLRGNTSITKNVEIKVDVHIDDNGELENNLTLRKVVPTLDPASTIFRMYDSLQLFFANGGGPCYVVSAETTDKIDINADVVDTTETALTNLKYEDEPTLILFPDLHLITNDTNYYSVYDKALEQCKVLGDRFTIIDIKEPETAGDDPVEVLRNNISMSYLKYGAAYYPNLKTLFNHRYENESVRVTEITYPLTGSATTHVVADITDPELLALKDLEYNAIKDAISKNIKVELPPGCAMAGIYARVDNDRGVWKAPANVVVSAVSEAVVKIDDEMQKGYNVDTTAGKSVNAIRFFTGKGILVWGARTLAGNDNEWRYVSVRRFYNMVEESIKKSSSWVVFEPNDANTWIKVKAMIENYLTTLWRQGALAGPSPDKAFFVKVGLGETMTALDILEGRMNIEIGMAAVRPAEFIILKFSHKMQEA